MAKPIHMCKKWYLSRKKVFLVVIPHPPKLIPGVTSDLQLKIPLVFKFVNHLISRKRVET